MLVGDVAQRAWYSPYGVPTGADAADVSGDGATNSIDYLKFLNWYSASDARADWNLDGSFNSQDQLAYLNDYSAAMTFGGRGVLTSPDLEIRIGYAGYRWDAELDKYHARHRVYDPYAGRWVNRDPIEYDARTLNLYEYVLDSPVVGLDPLGLQDPGWTRRQEFEFWRDLFKPKPKPKGPRRWVHLPDDVPASPGQEATSWPDAFDKLANPCPGESVAGISCHANEEDGPYYQDEDGNKYPLGPPEAWPDEWVNTLKEYESLDLWCCYVGNTDYGQRVANRVGIPVRVPVDNLVVIPITIRWPGISPIRMPPLRLPLPIRVPNEVIQPQLDPRFPGEECSPGDESSRPHWPRDKPYTPWPLPHPFPVHY